VADQGLLIPLRGGVADLVNLFTLNEVATEVWHALQEGLDLAEIAERLVSRFEIDREQALVDLDEFLGLLVDQGMVEPAAREGTVGAPA
jgi:hypothetical protein